MFLTLITLNLQPFWLYVSLPLNPPDYNRTAHSCCNSGYGFNYMHPDLETG